MKIAIDSQIFTSQTYGGVSRYFTELSCELLKNGQDVHIFSGIFINNYLSKLPSEVVSGIKITKYPPKTARIFQLISRTFTRLQINDWQPDIIHETYYSEDSYKHKKAKTIVTVYDMIHEKFADHFPSNNQLSRRKAQAVTRADHVICISEHTKQDLIELVDVEPEKISVIYLGYELSIDKNTIDVTDLPEEQYLLYVGSRRGYKNFESLLIAYASSDYLKDNYNLCCFGGGKFTESEKNKFVELGLLSSQIHHVSGDDALLAKYYKSASVFVYPSLYEGFGIPPLEAMSVDCPVVCSNASSIPEVVGDAALLFDPQEPESIKEAIETVLRSDDVKKELVKRGQERVTVFSWERCAKETLAVYQRVLS